MKRSGNMPGAGREVWPLLALLLLAVIVPTMALLWFMTAAVRNERIAVRQKLTDIYEAQLQDAYGRLEEDWKELSDTLSLPEAAPPSLFARLVKEDVADSIVVIDGTRGNPPVYAYPTSEPMLADDENDSMRTDLYERLRDLREQSRDDRTLDEETIRALGAALQDYTDSQLPSAQRVFLMQELQSLTPGYAFPTLHAEQLALQYIERNPTPVTTPGLSSAGTQGVTQLIPSGGHAIALFTSKRLRRRLDAVVQPQTALEGVRISVGPPGTITPRTPFLTRAAPPFLPEWQLRLHLDDPELFASAARRQITTYVWTGLLVIALVAVIAAGLIQHLLKQVRLTRLKNDFVATVTHELKTPLASTRLLVDTLLEGNYRDQQQVREYLELIAKENERLSRLIDNFLSFSRMERNKQAFDIRDVQPGQVATSAIETVRDRFEAAGCRLTVDIAPSMPAMQADPDAMVTVLLNLLDNAFKYSGEEKEIALRVHHEGGYIFFDVGDNGLGLSRRDQRKVLDRFYQVDQSLSRTVPGVGLGLSIVKFIVDAHRGRIDVESELGAGTKFSIAIPTT